MQGNSDAASFLAGFDGSRADALVGVMRVAGAEDVKAALKKAPDEVQRAADDFSREAFPGVPPKYRAQLYRTVILSLVMLAAGSLVGGGIALMNNAESAAFFTFAGLALGGITGLLAPSPTAG